MEKRVWLITGISSGLGKALAESVIERGDMVIGTFRKPSQVEAYNQQNIQNAIAVQLDLRSEASIGEAVESVVSRYGKIDVLVNNAGMGFVGAVEETSLKESREVFETNFFGTLQLTREVLPYMRKRKSGHIVQISSHGGIKAFAGFGIYNASKFALEGFSEALADEVAPLGIKVSIVEPGPFRTSFASSKLGQATTIIEDYSETAGAFRTKLRSVDGKQEGDPVKAAHAIIQLVDSDKPTLRLPLGKIALMTIKSKLDSVNHDLISAREIAEKTVFDR